MGKVIAASLCALLFIGCSDGKKVVVEDATTPTMIPTEDPKGEDFVVSKYQISKEELVPSTDTGEVTITDEMLERSVLREGNLYRLSEVMKRAADGEEITIAFIGGSITDGNSASPKEENCYAKLTYDWWVKSFPKAKINYVNAGIGATDSYLGVHRVKKDVLEKKPDLVIVEFSVNDYRAQNKESYESLLRALLNSETSPAVIPLALTQQDGSDYQTQHLAIAFYYDLAMLSYRELILPELESGNIKWSEIASDSDETHPGNGGHAIIAKILTSYFNSVRLELDKIEDTSYGVKEDATTKNSYETSTILDNTNLEPTANTGFVKETIANAQFPNGWKTTEGGELTFEVEGKAFGVIYYGTVDGNSGKYEVLVDGEVVRTLDANFQGKWGSYAEYEEVFKGKETGKHIVTIRKASDSVAGQFIVLGVTLAE